MGAAFSKLFATADETSKEALFGQYKPKSPALIFAFTNESKACYGIFEI